MSGDTHASAGLTVGLAATIVSGQIISFPVVVSLCWSVVGSLFPDLDQHNSKGNKLLAKVLPFFMVALFSCFALYKLGNLSVSGVLYRRLVGAGVLVGLSFFCKTRPHREFSHSILAILTGTVCVFVCADWWSCLLFFLGYASHLGLDLLNLKGESLLYPCKHKFCLKLCTSNGIVNRAIEAACGCISVLLLLVVGGIL